jgi:hypothetical protein
MRLNGKIFMYDKYLFFKASNFFVMKLERKILIKIPKKTKMVPMKSWNKMEKDNCNIYNINYIIYSLII